MQKIILNGHKDITAPDGGKITYTYDGSLLTDTTWSGAISGSIHRTYDNNFSITSESVNGGNIVSFQYDRDGLLTRAGSLNLNRNAENGMLIGSTLGNISDAIGYSSFGEVAAYQASSSGAAIFSVNYTRDDLGRIIQTNESIDGATHTYNYAYDTAGRLVNVSKDGVRVSQYVYDANGNRLSYTGSGGTISGSYDDQDRLLQYGTTNYTYTANGELLSKTNGSQTTNYQYDVMGNLRNVTLPDGKKIEYIIDGQNRRIGKKVNGIKVQGFLWESQLRIAAELDGNGNVVSRFVYGTKTNVPEFIVNGGQTYRVITDHLGSPRLIVDAATGSAVQRIDYDEFGQVISDTNPRFQPFGLAGGLYDQDLKIVRFGVRDYDPTIGRFLQPEPILRNPRAFLWYAQHGILLNPYAYAANDPLNYVDKNGLWVFSVAVNIDISVFVGVEFSGGIAFDPSGVAPFISWGQKAGPEVSLAAGLTFSLYPNMESAQQLSGKGKSCGVEGWIFSGGYTSSIVGSKSTVFGKEEDTLGGVFFGVGLGTGWGMYATESNTVVSDEFPPWGPTFGPDGRLRPGPILP